MVVREEKPSFLAVRVILADRAPLTLREVRSPTLPVLSSSPRLLESLPFPREWSGTHLRIGWIAGHRELPVKFGLNQFPRRTIRRNRIDTVPLRID